MKARSSDTSTNQNGDGLAMSSASSSHLHDLSILRKPIQTSITGFHEAMKAYNDGTDEIRKLLANECDIIYECKTCRNIFRSLANFISHKRIYCKYPFNAAHHFDFRRHNGCIDQDISTIIQAEHDHLMSKKNDKNSGTSSVNGGPKEKNQDKDLGSIIDRLVRREQANRLMKLDDFYDQVNQNLTQDEILSRKKIINSEQSGNGQHQANPIAAQNDEVLKLEKIATNNNVAVYQTIKSTNEIDNIKREINEVHDLMQKENTILGPDGKILSEDLVDSAAAGRSSSSVIKLDYACEICSNKFSTEKTLKLHIKTKHIPSTFVYPCPSCSQTFLQPSSVIRHLNNDHKKSMRRIRLMRDAIYRRRTRIDEVPVKGPSRELARLQTDKDRADAQAKLNSAAYNNWLGDGDAMNVMTSICANCGKTFERRAALLTHTKTCLAKNPKSSNSTIVTNENSSNDDSSKMANAEDSQNSLDDFMRMLNREKQIQAQAENEILIESNRASPIISDLTTSQSNSMDGDLLYETKSENLIDMETTATAATESITKNKRKRNRTRKAELVEPEPSAPNAATIFADDDTTSCWKMDEDGNLKILKSDPINGEFVINVTSSEIETFNKSSSPLSAPQTPPTDDETETTTDCTICKRQFANLSNLRRHIAMFHYRQKKFGCQMCEVRAFRKIDIVNHLQAIHSIGNENQEASKLVIVINIDKNKFSEEKNKAVAHAICKKRDKDNRLKNESLLLESVQQKQESLSSSSPPQPQSLGNDVRNTTTETMTIDLEKMITDSSKLIENDEHASTPMQTDESSKNICVDFELAIDVAASSNSNIIPSLKAKLSDIDQPNVSPDFLVHSIDESSSFTPPNSVTKDASKFFRHSSNSSLSQDDVKPQKRKSSANNKASGKNFDELLSRNSSNSSLSDECKETRRPVRKRIKTVNKDFVYDLSNLLKKEAEAYKEQHNINIQINSGRNAKRKSQAASIIDDVCVNKEIIAPLTNVSAVNSTSSLISSTTTATATKQQSTIKCIIGAAKEMARIAVNNSRACYNKIPEMPTERSIIPAKIIQMRQRSESIAILPNWSLTKTNNLSKKLSSAGNRSLSIDKLLTNMTTKQRRRRSAKKSSSSSSSSLTVSQSFNNSLLAATIATSNLSISHQEVKKIDKTISIKELLDRKIFQSNNSNKLQQSNVNNNTTNGGTKKTDVDNVGNVLTTCPTEEEFERYMSANCLTTDTKSLHYIVPKSAAASLAYTSHYDSSSSNSSNVDALLPPSPVITSPITPTKRITLLQRLAENKNRKLQQQQQQQQQQQESLLKINLYENGKPEPSSVVATTSATEQINNNNN